MGRLDLPDNDASCERVQQANARLSLFFELFGGAPVLGTSEEVEALLQVEQVLKSVAVLLNQGLQSSNDEGVRKELARYRENLLRLRVELAGMQQSAAGRRDHLQSQQQHLQAAKDWCAASRATR